MTQEQQKNQDTVISSQATQSSGRSVVDQGTISTNCTSFPYLSYPNTYYYGSETSSFPIHIKKAQNGFIMRLTSGDYVFQNTAELSKFLEKELKK